MASSLYRVSSEFAATPIGEELLLEGPEGHHASQVRRLRVGETTLLGDGQGRLLGASVLEVNRGSLRLKVLESSLVPEPMPRLTLIQALAKSDRDELALQMACELGVARVIPWQAERSVARWDDAKAAKNRARWQQIATEAAKQSLRAWHPVVESLSRGDEISKTVAALPLALALDPVAGQGIGAISLDGASELAVVVGPEGGISARELELLVASGAKAVRLGSEVLRTSTAGPVALAVLAQRSGRWEA